MLKDSSKAKNIISKDGLKIFYWTTHDSDITDKEFMILHPGSSNNHTALENLERELNFRRHPTLILDPRGSGYSDSPSEDSFYTLEKMSSDLERILNKESIEKPIFITHSLGFMPTVDYISRTDNALSLVGICTSYNFSKTTKNKLHFDLYDNFLRYVDYLTCIANNLYNKVKKIPQSFPDQSIFQDCSDMHLLYHLSNVPLKKIKLRNGIGKKISHWDISKQIKKIKAPMLLIYGDNDIMVHPKAGDEISKMAYDCQVEILQGGHGLPLSQPEKIIRTLEKYQKPKEEIKWYDTFLNFFRKETKKERYFI